MTLKRSTARESVATLPAAANQRKPGRKKNRTAAQIRAKKKARAAARALGTNTGTEKSMAVETEKSMAAGAEPSETAEAGMSKAAGASVEGAAGASVEGAAGAKVRKVVRSIQLHEVLRLADGDPGFEARAAAIGDTYGASVTELADFATDQLDIATEWADPVTEREARATNQTTSAAYQTPSTTNQTTSAAYQTPSTTNQTSSTTNQMSSATNQGTADDDLFFSIYGKTYGPTRVTVDGDYASTKQTWWVARIIDRRSTELGYEYRVVWLKSKTTGRRFYQRTWEPRKVLVDDDFLQEVELVNRWKNSKVRNFTKFCKKDEFGIVISADMQSLCMFNALKQAAELAGRPDIVTSTDIDDFVAAELRDYGLDLTKGTTWKVFKVFLRKLRDAGRDFLYRPLVNCNLAVAGRRGARVLEEVELFDGIYLCAAYNHSFVGHSFVLKVQGSKRVLYDQDDGQPVESADWINFSRLFVRSSSLNR